MMRKGRPLKRPWDLLRTPGDHVVVACPEGADHARFWELLRTSACQYAKRNDMQLTVAKTGDGFQVTRLR